MNTCRKVVKVTLSHQPLLYYFFTLFRSFFLHTLSLTLSSHSFAHSFFTLCRSLFLILFLSFCPPKTRQLKYHQFLMASFSFRPTFQISKLIKSLNTTAKLHTVPKHTQISKLIKSPNPTAKFHTVPKHTSSISIAPYKKLPRTPRASLRHQAFHHDTLRSLSTELFYLQQYCKFSYIPKVSLFH